MRVSISANVTTKSLKQLVAKALHTQQSTVNSLQNVKENPSVAKNYHEAIGRVDALEAVLEAINNNNININMLID